MNLRDSKEPQVSGQVTSREQKPLLKSYYQGPIGEHVYDSFGYYIQSCFYRKFITDECNDMDEDLIIQTLNTKKKLNDKTD